MFASVRPGLRYSLIQMVVDGTMPGAISEAWTRIMKEITGG